MFFSSAPWNLKNEDNIPELESAFLSNPYPSKAQIEELAKRTKLHEDDVETYFSIRRGDDPKTTKPSILAQNSERIQQDQARTKQGLNVFQRCVPLRNRKSLEAELREVEEIETYRARLATSEVVRKMLEAELHAKVQGYEIRMSEMRQTDEDHQKRIRHLECEVKRVENSEKSVQRVLVGVGEELREKDQMYMKEISDLLVFTDRAAKENEALKIGLEEQQKRIDELMESERDIAAHFLGMQKKRDQKIMELEAELRAKDQDLMSNIDDHWNALQTKNVQIAKLEEKLQKFHLTGVDGIEEEDEKAEEEAKQVETGAASQNRVNWHGMEKMREACDPRVKELKAQIEEAKADNQKLVERLHGIEKKRESCKPRFKHLEAELELLRSQPRDMHDYIKTHPEDLMDVVQLESQPVAIDSSDAEKVEERLEKLEKEPESSQVDAKTSDSLFAQSTLNSRIEEAVEKFLVYVEDSGRRALTERDVIEWSESASEFDSDSECSEFVVMDMMDSASEPDDQDSEIGAADTVADPEVSEDEDRDDAPLNAIVLTPEALEQQNWSQESNDGDRDDDW